MRLLKCYMIMIITMDTIKAMCHQRLFHLFHLVQRLKGIMQWLNCWHNINIILVIIIKPIESCLMTRAHTVSNSSYFMI